MEISLIRHGESQLTVNDKITCTEFKKWVNITTTKWLMSQHTLQQLLKKSQLQILLLPVI